MDDGPARVARRRRRTSCSRSAAMARCSTRPASSRTRRERCAAHRRQPGTPRLSHRGRSIGADARARRAGPRPGPHRDARDARRARRARPASPARAAGAERHRRHAQRAVAHDRDGHHRGRPVRLPREGRRADRRHGHRFDGLQPVGRRPDRASVGGRARAHARSRRTR